MIAVKFPLAWIDGFDWFFSRAESYLQVALLHNFAPVALVLAVTVLLEIAGRKNWHFRYGSRNFRIDVIYFVFYYSGVYHFLVLAWLYKGFAHLVAGYTPWLQLNLLADAAPVVQILVLYIVGDFIHYWNHRWRHAHRYLWAFHSIHHAQTVMTPMTNYRFHIFDETFVRLCLFVPLVILGANVTMWLWLDFVLAWILLAQHSEWNWSYGGLGRVFVSPYFHRIHHSTDERLQNCNFGGTFSFWDDLFGTAERKAPCPPAHGIAGDPVRESLLAQFVYPFAVIARDLRENRQVVAPVVRTEGGIAGRRNS